MTIALLSLLAAPAGATVPGQNGLVAFESNRPGSVGFDIWAGAFDPVPPPADQLTNAPGDDLDPAWSPDGSKIAFSSTRDGNPEIYVMEANGASETRITNNAAEDIKPTWSPDGSRIAFTSNRSGNFEVWTMNPDGSNPVNFTDDPDSAEGDPAWSPDGTRIAFQSGTGLANTEVFVKPVAGGPVTQISAPGGAAGLEPSWSPGGAAIAFNTASGFMGIGFADGSIDGGAENTTGAGHPAYAPSGSRLIADVSGGNGDIAMLRANAGPDPIHETAAVERHGDVQPRPQLVRHAYPDGNAAAPNDCDPETRCSLVQAAEQSAAPGDVILVHRGEHSINGNVSTYGDGLTFVGETGGARPRIALRAGDSGTGAPVLSGGRLMLNLEVDGGPSTGLAADPFGAVISDVVVTSGGFASASISDGALLRNSHVSGRSVEYGALTTGFGPSAIRGVTAVATAGHALTLLQGGRVDARNSIFRGSTKDIQINLPQFNPPPHLLRVSHSAFRPSAVEKRQQDVFEIGPGNVFSDPLLVDFATDPHQRAGSPTIDAGAPNALLGDTDIDGQARTQGPAPDIGADEATPPGPPDTRDRTAPVLSRLSLSNRRFRVAPRRKTRRIRKGAPIGTTFRYRSSEPARVSFTIERKTRGRRVGRRCRPLTRRRPRGRIRRCTRWMRAGALAQRANAGPNKRKFNGRIGRRALKRGTYRASLRATDGAGNRSATRRVGFRVVR